jgi:hypothetical protein
MKMEQDKGIVVTENEETGEKDIDVVFPKPTAVPNE